MVLILQSEKTSTAFLDQAPVIAENWRANHEAEIKRLKQFAKKFLDSLRKAFDAFVGSA